MQLKKFFLTILLISNLFAWQVVFVLAQERGVEICFLDVGQGDAIFIETPRRQKILIDGGPDKTVLRKLEQRMPFWDKTIDLMVLTHPHSDHLFGLVEVLKNYQVENILWTGVEYDSALYREWLALLENVDARTRIASENLTIILGENRRLKVLFPTDSLEGRTVYDVNDSSVVLKLYSYGNRALFTGDISHRVEALLIKGEKDLNSEIMQAPHHGSRTSTSIKFLEAVEPDVAVISVGRDNRFGHPSKEVLERLDNFNIKVLRTDIHQDICFTQKEKKPFLLSSPME